MEFISTLINGLSSGGTYAMIALGYTMVYGIAKMLNFAHGDIIMVGAYFMFLLTVKAESDILLAIPVAMIACIIVGVVVERFAYRPLRGASPLAVLITAIGVSYLLQSVGQVLLDSSSKTVMQAKTLAPGSLDIGSLSIDYSTIITLAAAAIIMVGLTLFIKLTRVGRAMVAVSEDKDAARLMGINVNFIITITFIIGSALAAVAAFFMLMKAPTFNNTMGAMPGIKAFTVAVIGGIGSIPGAMVGGILLGVVEAISLKIPTIAPYTDAVAFAILIVILLVKPSGLLGKKRREKV